MKFFLAAILTAALLSDIIPAMAAAADSQKLHPTGTVRAEAVKEPAAPAPVIKKIKPPMPAQEPQRTVWPRDFYYYSYNDSPYYSLSLPKDFGSDPLAGLPAAGPMLIRAQSDTVLMTFDALDNEPAKNRFFSTVFKDRIEIPLPPLGPGEEYEYLPPPRYAYPTDPASLGLPKQITDARIVDIGSGRTAENLLIRYLYLSCSVAGQPCMAVLTHSERNQKAFEGLFVFPAAEKQNYLPLVTFTAQSLRVKQ